MIAKILSFLDTVTLSITQWCVVCLTLALGVLVVMFKQQGTKLHSVQIDLLSKQLSYIDSKDTEVVMMARLELNASLAAYNKAKGVK